MVAATIALPIIVKQTSEITAGSIATNFLMFLPRIGRAFVWLPLALAAAAPFARKSKRWLPMAALVLANWLFFSIVNVPFEDRYLLTAVPAMIILAAQGWRAAAEMLPRYASPVLMIASSAVVIANVIPATRQPDLGYATVVQRLPRLDYVSLVSGDAGTEGAFIAAIALHDRQFEHVVLRGSKMLAHSGWSGTDYAMRLKTVPEVNQMLERYGVGTVILQRPPVAPHDELLQSAIAQSGEWREIPGVIATARVFERPVPPARVPLDVRIEGPGGTNLFFELNEK